MRLSALSGPPFDRQMMWWLCHFVFLVICWLQIGQRPCCASHRRRSCRYPVIFSIILATSRSSKGSWPQNLYHFEVWLL